MSTFYTVVTFTQDELGSPAYRSLEPVARALLIELRALRTCSFDRKVTLGIREARQRLCVAQRPIERGFKALVQHGWIEEIPSTRGQKRSFLLQSPIRATHG